MKKILIQIGVLLFLIGTVVFFIIENNKLNKELDLSIGNIKAYVNENSLLQENSIVFKLTIDQLNYYNDSIIMKMKEVQRILKIKDKDIAAMQYLLSNSSKTDTILFSDTLFRDSNLNIDTLIQDEWYSLKLNLQYPSKITVQPKFKNELYIITFDKKETVNTPKKFFLWRLFQRKQKVRTVEIYDKSPYSEITNKKFIEIIK